MQPVFPPTAEEARALAGQHGVEGFEYYCTPRAEHPRSSKERPVKSVDLIAGFDAFRFIPLIAPRSLLMVVGTEAVTKHVSTDAFAAAGEPKLLHWVEGASHVAVYDIDDYVNEAITQLDAFFRAELGAAAAAA
jgi:fermentation-respiration switch protein FrsA (DUF1100 family)